MIECIQCHNEYSPNAKAFPFCAEPKPTPTAAKGCLWIIIIFIALIILASPSSTIADLAPQPSAKNLPTVSAMAIFNAYETNEVKADLDYKGKRFKIQGYVRSISKNFLDQIIIHLDTPNQFMSIHCTGFKHTEQAVAQLSEGDQVTISGTGGVMIIGSPTFDKCELE